MGVTVDQFFIYSSDHIFNIKVILFLIDLGEKNEWKKGQYFMMLRLAITGSRVSPPLFGSIGLLEKEVVVKRLEEATKKLELEF